MRNILKFQFSFWVRAALLLSVPFCLFSCNGRSGKGDNVVIYDTVSISNGKGMRAKFCSNGARLMSLLVPDRSGKLVDVVIGFSDPLDYDSATEPYFGATIGRFGNRIAEGRFVLDGKTYQVPVNNGVNALHGGKSGFQYSNWKLEKVSDSLLMCSMVSPDGDMGFPGKLTVRVTYLLNSNGALVIDYWAATDKATVVNLTNHAFFNLNGDGNILSHRLMINASRYLPVDSGLIPTGILADVAGTPFDFRGMELIGKRIGAVDQQLRFGKGYDHNYVLNAATVIPAAIVEGDKSGISMSVFTDQPGLQFYSGNFMQGKNKLRNGVDAFRTAFCLETQHFPDSPNQRAFPSTVLRPGEVYKSKSIYVFSVSK